MPKPFSPASLRESVCRALGLPFLSRAEEASLDSLHLQLDGLRVLLVEDQLINQQVVAEILQLSGIKVATVSNGAEAIARLSEDPEDFDIVLMDIQMPIMDGYEATRQIRARSDLAALPIIAMTAHAMQEERERCLQAGMNDYLSKPFEVEELLHRLAQWTGREMTSVRTPSQGNGVFRSYLGLPGIEAAAAWQRFGANRALFARLLRDFVNRHGDAVDRLRSDLRQGRAEETKLLLHGLKGMAGNLGAMGLYSQAAALEPMLGDSMDEVEPLLAGLAHALTEVSEAANRLSADLSASPAEAQNHLEIDLVAGLGWLATLLARNELVAEQAFQQLQDPLAATGQKEAVERLEQAIEQLDFATARKLVQAIARTQGITLEPE
jgi:CheY-like chemotaxis protein/HPt (histidine-containing phosphotransfer) domain-containing protein